MNDFSLGRKTLKKKDLREQDFARESTANDLVECPPHVRGILTVGP